MGHTVTIGGDRLGSGNKNKTYLHNYERSTHDLSTDFLSSMGCGMLIPFMCELVTRDDKYEIDLNAGLRTIPTQGPMFGTFKLQVDVFKYPLRLCQALLHNNPLAIGLKANQIKFPKMRLYGNVGEDPYKKTTLMAANNSLVKYLQISGIGTAVGNETAIVWRDMFAAGLLGYYDIFKNYYANKQEKYAYTLGRGQSETAEYELKPGASSYSNGIYLTYTTDANDIIFTEENVNLITSDTLVVINLTADKNADITEDDIKNLNCVVVYQNGEGQNVQPRETKILYIAEAIEITKDQDVTKIKIAFKNQYSYPSGGGTETVYFHSIGVDKIAIHYEEDIILDPFELDNIDKMRYDILSFHQLGQSFLIDGVNDQTKPYFTALGDDTEIFWQEPLAGICVKTYQSDLFNNWLNTEIIDGENGIAEITAIATSSGSISIDQIQFAEKLYNLLNRIAISGGTYEDYLDAAYTQSAKKFEESPMWVGGLSDEIIFEEIVQTAPTENEPLGSMGGRGNLMGKVKGGKITVKIDEPALLIGIVSITPRIVYTQGNSWFNTEIDSLQDIHVPALDAIGFQNLMAEELHAGTTILNDDGTIDDRPIIGKVPAWIHYMTNIDRAYGDFAAGGGEGYMVLNRDYNIKNGILQDATTYIDPAKFNYAFAYAKRDAQNFWVKIKADIKARRLMSAKQIPTA